MKNSIRIRLLAAMSGLIIFFICFSWFLNSNFLQSYYIQQKKNSLIESSKMIADQYHGNPLNISLELERLERNNGIHIVIITKDKNIKYDSFIFNNRFEKWNEEQRKIKGSKNTIEKRNIPRESMLLDNIMGDKFDKEFRISIGKDPRLRTKFLNLTNVLSNGDILKLSTPIEEISHSVFIANKFFLITGIITIFIGIIVTILFSKKFTNPILELNKIAQSMSKLDFSQKYIIRTQDEIGELGKSINSLSEQLDKSITELQDANEKLKEDIQRERKLDEMRKEFVSSVSHELKTPIALIQGYAEGLKVNVNEDEESKNFYCDVIVEESNKMNKLVKNLLNLSMIESGYFKLERSDFDISLLINQILNKFTPIFEEKKINLQVGKDKEMFVNADILMTEQILVNYINNAINHVNDKRSIKVSVKEAEDKIRVSVFNSGKHISEEFIDKIWLSFYKIDKARTRAYGGTGLGLSIVRAIQQAHHNKFGAENKADGVEFWFELDKATVL
ncbi:sensor histidine kinase [Clostridium sp. ZS2-4]|uniref:sensor histidine kinase n=1 Tax=Clostridium sp. ZS2-4 TaxID=2987703 RepID=UPI00227B5E3B|nr:HAMP domain-containing sensor histidine kinase [Clostridium sp. ZS2-4]MCY6354651.1 HAMP domain-containing sensor histidine kinase [Clostridium sp. ZS2-4]